MKSIVDFINEYEHQKQIKYSAQPKVKLPKLRAMDYMKLDFQAPYKPIKGIDY